MRIKKGTVNSCYCFDVGGEIDVGTAASLFGGEAEKALLICKRLLPRHIQYRVPPLFVREGAVEMSIGGSVRFVTVDAKIYDYGAVTVRMGFPFAGSLEELAGLSAQLVENAELRACAVSRLKGIVERMRPHIRNPREDFEGEWEDYYVYLIEETEEPEEMEMLVARHGAAVARVLRSEKSLSASEIEDALKYRLSYYGNDLTLIDWNSTFIFDPEKSYDVQDVIEFAVIQLLELRLYDAMLDGVIERAHDELASSRERRFNLFPFFATLERLLRIKLDVSDIIDRVENSLKLIGDLYLAKVYRTASARFYLDTWKSAVREKLNVLESLYSTSWDRAQTRRMIVAEIAIILLFVIDIVLILLELLKP